MMRYKSIGGQSSMAGDDELTIDFYNSTASRGRASTVVEDHQPKPGNGQAHRGGNDAAPQYGARQRRKKVGFVQHGKSRFGKRGKHVENGDSKIKSDSPSLPSKTTPDKVRQSAATAPVTRPVPRPGTRPGTRPVPRLEQAATLPNSREEEMQDDSRHYEQRNSGGLNARLYRRLKGKQKAKNSSATTVNSSAVTENSIITPSKADGNADLVLVGKAPTLGDENANLVTIAEVTVSQPTSSTAQAKRKQPRGPPPPPPPQVPYQLLLQHTPPPPPRSTSSAIWKEKSSSNDIHKAFPMTVIPAGESSTQIAPEIDKSTSIVKRADFRYQLENIISSRGSPASTATSSMADRLGNMRGTGNGIGSGQHRVVMNSSSGTSDSMDPNQSAGTIISRLFRQALESYEYDDNPENGSVITGQTANNNMGKQFRFPVAGIDMPPSDEMVDAKILEPVVEEMDDVTRVVRIRKGFSYLSDVRQAAEVRRRAVDVTSRKPHEAIMMGGAIKASEEEAMLQEARARLHHSEAASPPLPPPPPLPPHLAQTNGVFSTGPTNPPVFLREMLDTVRARQLKLNPGALSNDTQNDMLFANGRYNPNRKSRDSDGRTIVSSALENVPNARQVSHDLDTARGSRFRSVDGNEFTSNAVDMYRNADRSPSTSTDRTPPTSRPRRRGVGSWLHVTEPALASSRSTPPASGVTLARDDIALPASSDYATPAGSANGKARPDATVAIKPAPGSERNGSTERSNRWNFATVLVDVRSDSTNDQRRTGVTDAGQPIDVGPSSARNEVGNRRHHTLSPPLSLGFVSSGSDYEIDSVTSPSDVGLDRVRLMTSRAARQRMQNRRTASDNRTPKTRRGVSNNSAAYDHFRPVSVTAARTSREHTSSRAVNVEVSSDFERPTTVGMVQIPSVVSSARWTSNGLVTNSNDHPLPVATRHTRHVNGDDRRQQTALDVKTQNSNGRSLLNIRNFDVGRSLEKHAERGFNDIVELSAPRKQRDVTSILAPLYVYPVEAGLMTPSAESTRESIKPQLEDITKLNGAYHVQMKLNASGVGSGLNGPKVGDESYGFVSPGGLSSNGVTSATWYEPTYASNDFRHISVATLAHLDQPTYDNDAGKSIQNANIAKSSFSDHEGSARHRSDQENHVARGFFSDDDRRPTRIKTGSHGRRSTSATRADTMIKGHVVRQLPASAVSFDIELQPVADRMKTANWVNINGVQPSSYVARYAGNGVSRSNASQPIYSLKLSDTMTFDINKSGASSQRSSKKQRTARRRRVRSDEDVRAGNLEAVVVPTSLVQSEPRQAAHRNVPVEVLSSDEDTIEAPTKDVESRTVELPRVVRGSILIRNPIDSIGRPRQIDVVTDEALTPVGVVVEDNTNMFDGLYRQSRENPVYLSDDDDDNVTTRHHHGNERRHSQTSWHSTVGTTEKAIVEVSYPQTGSARRFHVDEIQLSSENDFSNEIPIVRNAQSTSRSHLKKHREIFEESISASRPPLVDAPNGVRQTVDVHRDNEELIGPGHDATSTDGQAPPSVNVDAVSEKVNVTLENGVARIEVRVLSERVVPIRGSVDMFKKSSVIVTRLIEIDMTTNEERRRLYDHAVKLQSIDSSQVSGSSSSSSSSSRLSTKHTFELYKALSRIADQSSSSSNVDNGSSSHSSRSAARQHLLIERVLEEKQSRRGSGLDGDYAIDEQNESMATAVEFKMADGSWRREV